MYVYNMCTMCVPFWTCSRTSCIWWSRSRPWSSATGPLPSPSSAANSNVCTEVRSFPWVRKCVCGKGGRVRYHRCDHVLVEAAPRGDGCQFAVRSLPKEFRRYLVEELVPLPVHLEFGGVYSCLSGFRLCGEGLRLRQRPRLKSAVGLLGRRTAVLGQRVHVLLDDRRVRQPVGSGVEEVWSRRMWLGCGRWGHGPCTLGEFVPFV